MNKTIRKRFALKHNRHNDSMSVHKLQKKYHCSSFYVYWATSKKNLHIKMRRPNSVGKLEPFMEIIETWVKAQLKQKKNKDRLPIQSLHNFLKATQPTYSSGITNLRNNVHRLKQILDSKCGAYLTLTHEPHECQADFSPFYYYDKDGKETKGECVVLSFPHSGMAYLQVFPGRSTESMLQGMQNIFLHINCVPREIWFDNDPCFISIIRFKRAVERIIVPLFNSFSEHYGFKHVFMSSHSGNEKGAVEKSIGYLRHNLLVPVPVIEDFESFNKELILKSEKLYNRDHFRKSFRIPDRFVEDKKTFKSLPDKIFTCESKFRCKVDNNGCVIVDKAKRYFVDPKYKGNYVSAVLTHNKCVITTSDGVILYDDARLYRNDIQKNIDWSKIFPLLSKHPNTATTLPFVRALPRYVQIFLAMAFPQELKEFIGNFVMIYEVSDIEKAASVADICARERRIDRRYFLKIYCQLYNK